MFSLARVFFEILLCKGQMLDRPGAEDVPFSLHFSFCVVVYPCVAQTPAELWCSGSLFPVPLCPSPSLQGARTTFLPAFLPRFSYSIVIAP